MPAALGAKLAHPGRKVVAIAGAALEAALRRFLAEDGPALISVPMQQVPGIWDPVKRPPSQRQAN